MADVERIKKLLTFHKDFPKPGITFCDMFPVLRDPVAFESLITHFVHHIFSVTLPALEKASTPSSSLSHSTSNLTGNVQTPKVDVIVGLDARGFLLGPMIAQRLGAAFVPVRKRGKLPGKCVQAKYLKEYGEDLFEMQEDAIKPGQTVVVVDDLIATGGSAKAAGQLVSQLGGKTLEYLFVINLPFLKGMDQLDAPAYSVVDIDD